MSKNPRVPFVRIKNHRIITGQGILLSDDKTGSAIDFINHAYKFFDLRYPKFFKMDGLCKAGIVAAHVLEKQAVITASTGLVFSNASSSLDTDYKFQESMRQIASPSIFVYTLPNIVMGELSIRYKIRSENAFFVSKEFDPGLLLDYAEVQLRNSTCDNVLCGWLNLHNNEYDVFLWHVASLEDLQSQRGQMLKIYATTHE